MRLYDKAEQKLERFAIPGLIRIVAGFQFLVFVLLTFNPVLRDLIALNPGRIFEGEIWRLFSYVFLPRTSSILWIIIQVMFLWFISDGLEQAWGAFRVNTYFLGSMIAFTIGCFILHFSFLLPSGATRDQLDLFWHGGFTAMATGTGELIYNSLFLAFAVLYPNQEIRLMLILPIKIKYLAYVLGGYLLLLLFAAQFIGIIILFTLLPFAFFAAPLGIRALRDRASVAQRRQKHRANSLPVDEAFHRCHSCGKTEHDDPQLEFRVADDDEEYCSPCLEKRRSESAKGA